MQKDFHYYATYCAAIIAGFSHAESLDICYSAQFVDLCSATYLSGIDAPINAATTQLQMEMMDARTDIIGLQNITRIWAPFHFLPRDLYAKLDKWHPKKYMNKYRLICGPNGSLVADTVELAKGKSLQSIGIAMHVLADTWAHMHFAGTPSLVINNTNKEFYEILPDENVVGEINNQIDTPHNENNSNDIRVEKKSEIKRQIKLRHNEGNSNEGCEEDSGEITRQIKFRHSPSAPDDLEAGIYTNSLFQRNENTIMNLGHGRAGHLPDYSFIKYMYLPAWDNYKMMIKDNPKDYRYAFCQMIYAMKYLRGADHFNTEHFETDTYNSNGTSKLHENADHFNTNTYDFDAIKAYEERIDKIIRKRQLIACDDWKAFGEELSGQTIEDFDVNKYRDEYVDATKKDKSKTFLGAFIDGAIAHKGMVCNKIYQSGNKLAGFVKGEKK